MARPKEFDESAAIDAAVLRFWDRGYDATSVRDLAQAMGISGPSMYNTFGDKRALFRRSFERYLDKNYRDRAHRAGALPPRESISTFLDEVIEKSLDDPARKGCLLINSAIDVAPHDEELRPDIEETLVQMELFFRDRIEAGQRDGTISKSQSAEDFGRLLLSALVSIRVLSRARPERELLEGLMRPIYALLDAVNDKKTSK